MDKLVANYETHPVPAIIPSGTFWGHVDRYCHLTTEVNSTSSIELTLDQTDDTNKFICNPIASENRLNIAEALFGAIVSAPNVQVPLVVKVVADWAIATKTDSETRSLPEINARDIAAQVGMSLMKQNSIFRSGYLVRKDFASYPYSVPIVHFQTPQVEIGDDVVAFCRENNLEYSFKKFIDLAKDIFPMAKAIKCELAIDPEIDKLMTIKLSIKIKSDVDILLKLDTAFTKSMIVHIPNRDLGFFVKTYEIANERD